MVAAPAPLPSRQDEFVDVADRIGCRLVRDALWSGERCTWMVWNKEPVAGAFTPTHRTAPAGLYLGAAGIAWFLAHLARRTGDRLQRDTALAAMRQVAGQIEREKDLGFYSGAAGAAWALVELGRLLDREELSADGIAALRRIARDAPRDGSCDLLSGKAGLVALLAAVGDEQGEEELVDAAARTADALVAAAVRQGGEASWPSGTPESQHLIGLSHGTTGALLALLEMDRLRPTPAWRETAQAALAYERARYDVGRRNWPDYRLMPGAPPAPPTYPVAWCHGSTGIGLARLRLLDLLPGDAALLPETDGAMANSVEALNAPLIAAETDLTLCHGRFGHGELLIEIADRLDRPDALAAARQAGDAARQLWHGRHLPWRAGLPEAGESPSLMVGSAGIGLHFLRLDDPQAIASPLLPPPILRPPARARPHNGRTIDDSRPEQA